MEKLKSFLISELSRYRSLLRLLESSEIRNLFECLSFEEKQEFMDRFKEGNKNVIENLILLKQRKYDLYEDIAIMDLRQIGRSYGIRNYNSLSRSSLIFEIQKYAQRQDSRIKRADETFDFAVRSS